MGKTSILRINRFDRGVQTALRSRIDGGAGLVKHFDIYSDPRVLKPLPGYETFVTDEEKKYEIKALGSSDDTLYGAGKGLSDWFGTRWENRVLISYNTSLATDTAVGWHVLRLDQTVSLPANFWTEVQSNGGDIRFTGTDGVSVKKFYMSKFDVDNEEATFFFPGTITDMYMYYGCQDSIGSISDSTIFSTNENIAMLFDNTVTDMVSGDEFSDQDTPIYTEGYLDTALYNGVQTDASDNTAVFTRNYFHISFAFYYERTGSTISLIDFGAGNPEIDLLNTGVLRFAGDGSVDNWTIDSTTVFTVGNWYFIDFVYNGVSPSTNCFIYVNGVLDNSNTDGSGNMGGVSNQPAYIGTTPSSGTALVKIDHVIANDNTAVPDANKIYTVYQSMTSASFWTSGSEESFGDATRHYDYLQIWEKPIDGSSNWKEVTVQGVPLRASGYYATDTFVDPANKYATVTAQHEDYNAYTEFMFIGVSSTNVQQPLDANNQEIGILSQGFALPWMSVPVDKQTYFQDFDGTLSAITGGVTSTGVYDAFANIQAHVPYQYYLAVTGYSGNRSSVEIYDLNNDDPLEFIDIGVGEARNIVNANGTLLAVVGNFIESEAKSNGEASIDIRKVVDSNKYQTTHKFPVDNVDATNFKKWEKVINSKRIDITNTSLFYVDPESSLTGMWAIGANEQTLEIGLSIYYDTADLGKVTNYHSTGNAVFIIHNEDGSISKVSDSYNQVSRFESLILDDFYPTEPKQTRAVEILFEDYLPTGQVVDLYYNLTEDNTWVQFASLIGDGTKRIYEITNILGGSSPLPTFKEMQIAVESTGGSVGATDINARIEYVNSLIS